MSDVLDRNDEDELRLRATDARDDGEDELYCSILEKLISISPDNHQYVHDLIHAKVKQFKYKEAEDIALSAFERYSDDPIFLFDYAYISDQTSDWNESIRRRKIIFDRFDPSENPNAVKVIAESLIPLCESGRKREAKQLILEYWGILLKFCPHPFQVIDRLEELNLHDLLADFTERARRLHQNHEFDTIFSNTLLLYENAKKNRAFMLDLKSDVKIVSIGQNCLPYSLTTRWGFNLGSGEDDTLTIFDFGGFPDATSTEFIRTKFSPIYDENEFCIETKPNGRKVAKLRTLPILFNHEAGNYWLDENFVKLRSRLFLQIQNLNKLLEFECKLFVFSIVGPCDLRKIILDFQELLDKGSSRLLILNTTQNEYSVPEYSNITYMHIPYPKNYLWNVPTSYASDEGYKFESQIAQAVKKELEAFSTEIEVSGNEKEQYKLEMNQAETKKSILFSCSDQGRALYQILSSIPSIVNYFDFRCYDNDSILEIFRSVDDQSRANIVGIIEQITQFYPGLDRTVAQGQWFWFTFPHIRIDGYFPFAGHDPRFTAPDPAYPTGRFPFTDRIAAATAVAVHESGKPVTDDELFDLYMRATEAELPFAADNILMDFRRIIDHDVRTHVKLLDYVYTNHKTTRMVHAPEALTGTLIGKIASDLLDSMLPHLPIDAERCRTELRYLLTGYEGDASVQTPIHPALARHLGLDWITPDTTYRIFGNRWTFRQAMIHYLRASPWLL